MSYYNPNQRVADQYAAAHHVSVFEPIKFSEACEIVGPFEGDAGWASIEAPVLEWLASFDDKITDAIVITDAEENNAYACAVAILWAVRRWARDGGGTFAFVRDMADASHKRGLTAGMIRGLMNCMQAEVKQARREMARMIEDVKPFTDDDLDITSPAALFAAAPDSNTIDLTPLLAARYAVPDGDTRLKIQISRPTRGNWVGWTYVSDGAEYGFRTTYGRQAPGSKVYVGQVQEQLRAILADPKAAIEAYCLLTGTCAMCGRVLEAKTSVAAGMGPICAGKAGF